MLDGLAERFSLQVFDASWRQIYADSLILSPWRALERAFAKFGLEKIGALMQKGSFLLALILIVCLALPQFANDKEGLAAIALLGLGLWTLGHLFGGGETRKLSSIDLIVLSFLGANIISTAASHYFMPAVKGLLKVIVYMLTYFWLTGVFNKAPRRRLVAVAVLVACAVGMSLYGLYQYKIGVAPLATWEDPTVDQKGTRIFGTLGNPNLLAGYLVPIMPFALSLSLAFLFKERKDAEAKRTLYIDWIIGAVCLAATGLIILATVLTGSRGGYIGLLAELSAIVLIVAMCLGSQRPKQRFLIYAAAIALPILFVVGLMVIPSFHQRLLSIFSGAEHSSNAYRMNVWRASLKMLKDSWWFGVGPGNQAFRMAYGLYMVSGFDALGTYCVPLEVAVECGVFGLTVFAGLIVSLLSRAHLEFWHGLDNRSRFIVAGAAAALIGLMAHGMVDTVFYRPQVQFIFCLVISIIAASDRD